MRYERAAWVQPMAEAGVDSYYRPRVSSASPMAIRLAVIEDPTVLAKVDPGLVSSGAVLAYARESYSGHLQPKAQVWWDDAENSSGVRYEVQRVEDYRAGFGHLGNFQRMLLARIEV